jgi:hypothetical protein
VRQLPLVAVRDLLGICRAMYAAKARELAPVPVLNELAAIGEKLKLALKLGKSSPDSIGHKAAWNHAEEATARLMKLISIDLPLAPTVEAAVIRIRRVELGPNERNERRAAAKIRS